MAQGIAHEVEVGDSLRVGNVEIAVEQKSGRKVRLRIVAPEEMEVSRRKKETGESRLKAELSA